MSEILIYKEAQAGRVSTIDRKAEGPIFNDKIEVDAFAEKTMNARGIKPFEPVRPQLPDIGPIPQEYLIGASCPVIKWNPDADKNARNIAKARGISWEE